MVKIRRLGSYLVPDAEGFLINPSRPEHIHPQWKAPIQDVIHFYQGQAQNLISIYVRGSVARGTAVEHISDLDTFCVTPAKLKFDSVLEEKFLDEQKKKYPFCTGIELVTFAEPELALIKPPLSRAAGEVLIKTQSVCVWGKDHSKEFRELTIEEMKAHSFWIEKEITQLKSYLLDAKGPEERKQICTWIMKRSIRSAFEQIMITENKWTRDLSLCYESVSKQRPESESQMKHLLHLALNPTDQIDLILKAINDGRKFLLQ